MKKLISALTATTLLFAVSCTGAATTGSTTGGTDVTVAPLPSPTQTENASAGPSASSGTATGGATTGATTGGIARGCELVSSMDAESVVGHIDMGPRTQSGTLPGTSAQADLCVFEGVDGKMTVGVLEHTSSADFSGFAKAIPGVQQLSGIGDQAYLAKGSPTGSAAGASLLVLKGDTYLSLSATSTTKSADDLADALRDLAKTVVDDL